MYLFLIIYLSLFFISFYSILTNKIENVVYFIIFGLPIYITSLSVAHLYDFKFLIPFLQSTKEIIFLCALLFLLNKNKHYIVLNNIDKLILFYLIFIISYIILPIGPASVYQKLISTKTIAFFPIIYFVGRFIEPNALNIEKIFKLISLFGIFVAIVLIFEIFFYQNLQNITGYADFMSNYFNQETSGNFGLSWTFETDNGLKRFASIYSMPLEHAAGTLITISAILSLLISDNYKINIDKFLLLSIVATIISIIFALSRASFLGYIIIIYAFLIITNNRRLKLLINIGLVFIFLTSVFLIKDDIKSFFIGTINFTNSSSLTHLLAWTEAIITIYNHPMGIGLGSIGSFVNKENSFFAGENEFLIIGVQVGIVPMILYLFIYFNIIKIALKSIKIYNGKVRKTSLFLFFVKLGLIVPLLTSEIESYIYISYFTWFMSGYLLNILSRENKIKAVGTIYV
jgi:hypothetical protein